MVQRFQSCCITCWILFIIIWSQLKMNVKVFGYLVGEHNVLDTMNRLQRSNVHVTLAQTRSQKMLVGGGPRHRCIELSPLRVGGPGYYPRKNIEIVCAK